jgi:hypothetical protein
MAEQTVELAPGESKLVSFEAIPHEARTYQVSVDGLSGTFTAKSPVIEFGQVDILSINNIPFSEVGVDSDGVKYGFLQSQISQPNLVVTVNVHNKSIRLDNWDYIDFFMLANYTSWGGPGFRGRAGVQLQWDRSNPNTPYGWKNPPFDFSVTPNGIWVAGSWSPKVYSCEFRLGLVYWDIGEGPIIATFRVKDFLKCTGSGSIGV